MNFFNGLFFDGSFFGASVPKKTGISKKKQKRQRKDDDDAILAVIQCFMHTYYRKEIIPNHGM